MRLLRASLLLAVVSLLPACDLRDCATPPHSAVLVTVVDARGNPIPDAHVTFIQDGRPEEAASCMQSAGATRTCETWSVGESPGDFRIRATSADGSRTALRVISVDETTCGHITENVQLTLPD